MSTETAKPIAAEMSTVETSIFHKQPDVLGSAIVAGVATAGAALLIGRFARDPSNRRVSLATGVALAATALVGSFQYGKQAGNYDTLVSEHQSLLEDYISELTN